MLAFTMAELSVVDLDVSRYEREIRFKPMYIDVNIVDGSRVARTSGKHETCKP